MGLLQVAIGALLADLALCRGGIDPRACTEEMKEYMSKNTFVAELARCTSRKCTSHWWSKSWGEHKCCALQCSADTVQQGIRWCWKDLAKEFHKQARAIGLNGKRRCALSFARDLELDAEVSNVNTAFKFEASTIGGMNMTTGNVGSKQVEHELPGGSLPRTNKVWLAVIYFFHLYFCGVDRCFLGQICIGIIKGMTLGGVGIWALLDFLIIIKSMLMQDMTLDTLGMQAQFTQDDVQVAFWITVVGLVLYSFGGPVAKYKMIKSPITYARELCANGRIDAICEESPELYEKLDA